MTNLLVLVVTSIIFILNLILGLDFSSVTFATESSEVANNSNSILDTPIETRIVTTPRQVGNFIGSTVIGGAIGYGAWQGIRLGAYAAEHTGGSIFTKTTLIFTGAITGATYGLLANAIGRAQGPRGPFANISITISNMQNNTVAGENPSIGVQTDIVSSSSNEAYFASSPFESLIDPVSNIPIIAIISISIIFILIGLNCLNFIIIRLAFIKYFYILEPLKKSFPKIWNFFYYFYNIFNRLGYYYYLFFFILAYINFLGGIYGLYVLLKLIVPLLKL